MPKLRLGRTRLLTRRERLRTLLGVLLVLLGALGAVWLAAGLVTVASGDRWAPPALHWRPILTGTGHGLLGQPDTTKVPPPTSTGGWFQFPLTMSWSADAPTTAVVAVPMWMVWLRLVCRPVFTGLRREARREGLADRRSIHARLGVRAARRAGSFTLPETPWWQRLLLPTTSFGFRLGTPQAWPRLQLVANWEQRIRIVARPGWGKTLRAMVPIIRDLPGPALICSTEPGIFESTVLARQFRRRPTRWPWLGLLLHWTRSQFPVAVVDFSPPTLRYAAGFLRVLWNLIDGCAIFDTALRRARALVDGVERAKPSGTGNDGNDQFFRDSAAEVLAAWLHAADLGDRELSDLIDWIRNVSDPLPRKILTDNPRADASAALNLDKHLDPRAGTTNSGVERYLILAMNALASDDGREFSGRRFDAATGTRLTDKFDMAAFIAAGGTVYMLVNERYIRRVRPLLGLFASEMFTGAEEVALGRRHKRLAQPFIGVFDELRYGVPVPFLPYVANAQRKYGCGWVYSVQSSTQEDETFGKEADAVRNSAGVTIYGGIDMASAADTARLAGSTPVVTTTHGSHYNSEQVQWQEALTVADQQQLADGEATIVARGLTPFIAYLTSVREKPALHRRIQRETKNVAAHVIGARAADRVAENTNTQAHAAGTDFGEDSS